VDLRQNQSHGLLPKCDALRDEQLCGQRASAQLQVFQMAEQKNEVAAGLRCTYRSALPDM
jgi:hypothetical protein